MKRSASARDQVNWSAELGAARAAGFDLGRVRYVEDEITRTKLVGVQPYISDLATMVKRRWNGRTLEDIVRTEFKAGPFEYYQAMIDAGGITLNGEVTTMAATVVQGDYIHHRCLAVEPAVLTRDVRWLGVARAAQGAVQAVATAPACWLGAGLPGRALPAHATQTDVEDDASWDVAVLLKPASLPLHPVGTYRHVCLLHMVATQALRDGRAAAFHKLYPVHRLDRVTSGLLMVARTPATAKRMTTAVAGGHLQKWYCLLAEGAFPDAASAEPGAPAAGVLSEQATAASASAVWLGSTDQHLSRTDVLAAFDLGRDANIASSASEALPPEHARSDTVAARLATSLGLSSAEDVAAFTAKPWLAISGAVGWADASTSLYGVVPPERGKAAVTLFKAVRQVQVSHAGESRTCTLVIARPISGRTHQIRVHAAAFNCAIANDAQYAAGNWRAANSMASAPTFRKAREGVVPDPDSAERLAHVTVHGVPASAPGHKAVHAGDDTLAAIWLRHRGVRVTLLPAAGAGPGLPAGGGDAGDAESGDTVLELAARDADGAGWWTALPMWLLHSVRLCTYSMPQHPCMGIWLASLAYHAVDGTWGYAAPAPAWAC